MTQKEILSKFGNINKVIKILTFSDTINYSGWNLINPILGVYIADKISNGNIAVVGISTTIYLVVNGLLQVPVALMLDKNRGEKDDFKAMFIGTIITAISAFLYLLASQSWHIYIIQSVSAVGVSISYPAWTAIFSRHLDKERESFEWSLYNTLVGFGGAISAGIGAIIAERFGYQVIFLMVGSFSLLSAFVLLFIKKRFIKT